MRRWLAATVSGLALSVTLPGVAHALPVAVVAGFLSVSATSFVAIAATFVINTAIGLGLNFGLSKLASPKASMAARQASVTQLGLGEGDREAIFGEAVTGGQLCFGFNYGGANGTDWEVLDIKAADHFCDELVGVYVNDTFVAYSGDGAVSGYSGQLEWYWRPGTETQTIPSLLTTYGGSGADDNMAGCARFVVAYKADAPNSSSPVWSAGRPTFKLRIKGKRCYDPRLDTSVGGSGSHRWNDPDTWEWTDNAYVCRYNWVRGIYACDRVDQPDQLLIGRGLSAILAPPENAFAPANVCDEAVGLLAGGTEPRYRVNGVVKSGENFRTTDEMFAAAMAGVIVQRSGAVEIEPGQNKTPVLTITDGDLVVGEPVQFSAFLGKGDRINTVVSSYVEPDQNWQAYAAPVRRVLADITADKGPETETLNLALVTSGTQAQRCGEIQRRMNRLERRMTITLGPRFSALEEGDWIEVQSDRRQNGDTFVYRVESWKRGQNGRTTLQLREVATNIATWSAALDEAVPGGATPPDLSGPAALALSGVSAVAEDLNGVAAVLFSWTAPVDPAITSIRMEVREVGSTDAAHGSTVDVNAGYALMSNGVPAQTDIEGRLIPLGEAGRSFTPSSWVPITSLGFAVADLSLLAFLAKVSAAEVKAGFGVNVLIDTDFRKATDWWRPDGDAAVTSGVIETANGVRYYEVANSGGSVGQEIRLGGDNQVNSLPIKPGARIEVQGLVGADHVSNLKLHVRWLTAAGGNPGGVVTSTVAWSSASPAAGGGEPDTWSLADGYATAPAGAYRAMWWMIGTIASGGTAKIRVTQPLLAKADPSSGATDPSPYNPGIAVPGADVTGDNTAAAIVGQGSMATKNIFRQGSAPSSGMVSGDIWVKNNVTPNQVYQYDASTPAWVKASASLAAEILYSGGATVDSLKPGEVGANVTETRTAAAISGQGRLATAGYTISGSIPGSGSDYDQLVYTGSAYPQAYYRLSGAWHVGASWGAEIGTNLRSAVHGDQADADVITNQGTAAAIANQTGWATQASYGWSYNQNIGSSGWRNVDAPLTATHNSITVGSHTFYYPSVSGSPISGSTGGGTITGLAASTPYVVYVNASTGALLAATGSDLQPLQNSNTTWIRIGAMATPASDDTTYPTATIPPGGGGALDAWAGQYAFRYAL